MEDLKTMPSMGETVQTYFAAKFLETLKANMAMPEMQKRYSFNGEVVPYTPDPESYCEHCGHSLADDPDY